MKKKCSNATKRNKRLVLVLTIFHILCVFTPITIFISQSLTSEISNSSKVTISLSAVVCLILLIISLMSSAVHRLSLHKSIIWIILFSMAVTLPTIKTFIEIMAILSLIDELILIPLKNKYSSRLEINKELDKRDT